MPYFLLIFTAFFWASNFVAAKGFSDELQPFTLAFMRWAACFILMSPFLVPRLWKQRRLIQSHLWYLGGMGFVSVGIFTSLIYLGVETTQVMNASILQSMTPIAILVMCALILKERINSRQYLGVSISFIGVILLVTKAELSTLLELSFAKGDFYLLLAMLTWAAYSVLLRWRPDSIDGFSFFGILVLAGTLFLAPCALIEMLVHGTPTLSLSSSLTVVYMALFPSIIATMFWNHGVQKLGAATAGLFIHLIPIFGFLLSSTLLGEQMRAYHLAGLSLILTGVFLALPKISITEKKAL